MYVVTANIIFIDNFILLNYYVKTYGVDKAIQNA